MHLVDILNKLRGWGVRYSNKLLVVGLIIISFSCVIAISAPYIVPHDPYSPVAKPYISPFKDLRYPLGTNFLGYDVLSRLIWGARNSLLVALLAVFIAASVGVPLGLFAGYIGGYVDRVITLIMDSMYAFPGIILALALAFILGPGVVNTALALAVIYVPTYYRVTRGTTLSIKEQLYVEAARAIGASSSMIVRYYIAPNVVPTVIPILALNFADAIITEAGLSFLGVGLPPTEPDWGVDLAYARGDIVLGIWWTTLFPGLAIFTATLGFLLLAEGLSAVVSPRLK